MDTVSAAEVEAALRGSEPPPLSAYETRHPGDAIAMLGDFQVKALTLTSFAGEPFYLATNGRAETRLVPVRGAVAHTVGADRVARLLRRTFGSRLTDATVLHE